MLLVSPSIWLNLSYDLSAFPILLVAYSIFYLFFEAFPLVFVEIYNFREGVSGLPFIGIIIGSCSAYTIYASKWRHFS